MGKDLKGKELGKGISQRADGNYMGRFVDKYKKRHTYYNRDLKVLKKTLDKARYEAEHGIYGDGSDITVSEWFEEFMRLYKVGKVKDTTEYRIRQTFANCRKDMLGDMKLQAVRCIHVQNLVNSLHEKGFSYGTINLLKSLLKEMFKMAIANGYMLVNPCEAVVMPKKVKYEPRFLTEQEQDMFLEAAKEYYHYDVFCMNLSCGARIGEVLGLKWSDINFEDKTIHIQRTLHYAKLTADDRVHFFFTSPKTETSDRIIPLLPETETVLRRVRKKQLMNKILNASSWHQEPPFEDMVFTSVQGTPVMYGDVNRAIKKAIVKANLQEEEFAKFEGREPFVLKEFSPHCFRHTFVTRCKKNGIPYETIQPYVGHSDKEMTEYYDHNKPEMDVVGLKKISFLNVV
ncbi:MAG: tyrosine-type recombinase/integrase [Eubacteriales bacterium]|nr:tyrosine-type recombinase/integrase [Eubacteriales bacterium]